MTVLVVGLGGIGQRHVRNLRQLCGSAIRIVACRVRGDRRVLTDRLAVEPGADLHERYGIDVEPDLDRALARSPDVVLVCNPTRLHVPVALAAARAGCHLFIEKPLSDSWIGVDDLVGLVGGRKLAGLVGFQMRFHPALARLRALLAGRAVGRVISVRAFVGDYLPAWHAYEDYRGLYAASRALGGGVVLTQIHEIDYLISLFGMPRRVCALGGRWSALDVDVEDTASLLLDCAVDGRPVPVHLHQDFRTQPATRTCEVIGENGRIEVDFQTAAVSVTDARGQTSRQAPAAFERNDMFLAEMRHFLACVRREVEPVVSIAESTRSLRVALAARESIASGAAVAVA